MIKVNSNVTTIELTGSEEKVQFAVPYPYYWVLNASGAEMYASMSEGITANADGVVPVPIGGVACTMHGTTVDTVYLLGTGSCVVMGTYSAFCPFKFLSGGGDSGGIDEQARSAIDTINTKLATNAPYKVLRGSVSGSSSSSSITINFSSGFNSAPTVVGVVRHQSSGYLYSCFVTKVSVTSVTFEAKYITSSGSLTALAGGTIDWIAMGI